MRKLSVLLLPIILGVLSCRSDQRTADILVKNSIYYKDPQINTCFVYISAYTLATVPCEKIPENLLYVGNVNK